MVLVGEPERFRPWTFAPPVEEVYPEGFITTVRGLGFRAGA